jgi:hypothetical protein
MAAGGRRRCIAGSSNRTRPPTDADDTILTGISYGTATTTGNGSVTLTWQQ